MDPSHGRFGFALRRREPTLNGQNCSVFLTDVAGFSAPDRTDEHRRMIRQALYEIVEGAFAASGIPWDACHREDRGDGVLIVIPPDVSTALLVNPLIESLAARLRRHNARADAATSFQLRAALDVGPVTKDRQGVTGKVIIQVSRLVDAQVLKRRLAAAEQSCLGFIASTFIYDCFINQRPGHVDPADYVRVSFRSKGSRYTGWMYLAGRGGENGHTA